MAFLIIAPTINADAWAKHIRNNDPDLDLRIWPDTGDTDDITFILAWDHPHGALTGFRNLKCIASMGAGVDHLMADPRLPETVPVTRIVHPSMPDAMSQYVMLAVLDHCRHFRLFFRNQERHIWKKKIPIPASRARVGIMGMGQLGMDAARKLTGLGFAVAGWCRTPKTVPNVEIFAGSDLKNAFLARSDILVCMLPLTPGTRGILDADCFSNLPEGAYVINVARGEHLVEDDLLAALDKKHLSGACLDVFRTEPLPTDHAFWDHPDIVVTPHISSLTNPKAVVPQIVENYHRVSSGKVPHHMVDRSQGY